MNRTTAAAPDFGPVSRGIGSYDRLDFDGREEVSLHNNYRYAADPESDKVAG
jgi:hypothetical protein